MNSLRGGKKSRSTNIKRRSCKNMKSRTCKRSKKCSWRKRSKRAKGSCAKKSRRRKLKGGSNTTIPGKGSGKGSAKGPKNSGKVPKKKDPKKKGSNGPKGSKGKGSKGKGSKGKGSSTPPSFPLRNIVAIVNVNGGTYREFQQGGPNSTGARAAEKWVADNQPAFNGNFIKVPYAQVTEFLNTAQPIRLRQSAIEASLKQLREELKDLEDASKDFYRKLLY